MKTQFIFLILLGLVLISNLGCSFFNPRPSEPSLHAVWAQDLLDKKNIGFRKVNRMTPLVVKNQIIAGSGLEGLVSYDVDTYREKWRTNIPYGVEAAGVFINDRLFVGGNNGRMYSINLNDGSIVWEFDSKSEMLAEPLLEDGVLYFISATGSVFSLDAATGRQRWTYNRQDTASVMTIRGGSKPALSQGILYVGFSDGSLVALNAQTGTQQWEILLNRNTRFRDIDASPVIDENYIYINSYDDAIYCLSKQKGEIVWSAKYGGFGTPLIVGEYIINASSKGELVSLKKKDGSLVWKQTTKNGIFTGPVLMKGLIVTGESQGKLLIIDSLTGAIKDGFEPGRGILSKPSVDFDRNKIYFTSGEANIYGLQLENSNLKKIDYLR